MKSLRISHAGCERELNALEREVAHLRGQVDGYHDLLEISRKELIKAQKDLAHMKLKYEKLRYEDEVPL